MHLYIHVYYHIPDVLLHSLYNLTGVLHKTKKRETQQPMTFIGSPSNNSPRRSPGGIVLGLCRLYATRDKSLLKLGNDIRMSSSSSGSTHWEKNLQ